MVQLAKQLGWQRDVRARARQAAAAMLRDAPLVLSARLNATASIVERWADVMVIVQTKHRLLLEQSRGTLELILGELKALQDEPRIYELYRAALAETEPLAKTARTQRMMERIVGLPSRIAAMKTLSDAARNIILLERQAYNLEHAELAPPQPRENMTAAEGYQQLLAQKPAA